MNFNFNTRKVKKIEKKGYGRVFYGYFKDDRLLQTDKLVYGYLCSLAGEKCRCFPRRKLICKDLHMSENTLSRSLRKLVDFGYLTILKERKNGIGFQHNIYAIHGINDDIYMDIDTQKNSKFALDDAKIENINVDDYTLTEKNVNIDDYTVKEKNVNAYSEISEEKNEHFEDENLQNSEQISDVSDENDTYSTNQNHTTNNKDTNNINIININKEIYKKKEKVDKGKEQSTKKSKDQKIEMLISEYTSDCELKETLHDFLDMRKSMKKPMTFRAVKILLNKLDGIATETDKKIEVLERSILNGWKGIYEVKNDQWENKKNTYNASNEQKSSSKHTTDTKTTHSNNTHYASNEQKNEENDGKTTSESGFKLEKYGITREQYESFRKRYGFDDPDGEVHQRYLRLQEMTENKIPKHWKNLGNSDRVAE